MDIINIMFVSTVVGIIVAIPAIISEVLRRGKNLPILMDVHACWGRKCSADEVFLFSLFTHFILSVGFGGFYMFLAMFGWGLHDFNFVGILEYGILFWIFVGAIILPAARLGFFGQREGRWVWLELLVSYLLQSFGFWAAFQLFPIFLP